MPPQNQQYPPPQNQYDFIMNPNQHQPRQPLIPGNSKGVRIALVAVLFVFIIIIAVVVNSFLGKESKAQNQRLIEIAQTQAEIIRVSAIASKPDGARSLETQTFALNTRLSVESSQQQTKRLLAGRGVNDKGIAKQLAEGKNPKSDAALTEATKNNRFDETFTALMNKQLTDYQKLLQAAYPGSTPNERTTLTTLYENAGRLVVKTAAESTPSQ